jgi:hypothetical protein
MSHIWDIAGFARWNKVYFINAMDYFIQSVGWPDHFSKWTRLTSFQPGPHRSASPIFTPATPIERLP